MILPSPLGVCKSQGHLIICVIIYFTFCHFHSMGDKLQVRSCKCRTCGTDTQTQDTGYKRCVHATITRRAIKRCTTCEASITLLISVCMCAKYRVYLFVHFAQLNKEIFSVWTVQTPPKTRHSVKWIVITHLHGERGREVVSCYTRGKKVSPYSLLTIHLIAINGQTGQWVWTRLTWEDGEEEEKG